jgi:hypothetical protein
MAAGSVISYPRRACLNSGGCMWMPAVWLWEDMRRDKNLLPAMRRLEAHRQDQIAWGWLPEAFAAPLHVSS